VQFLGDEKRFHTGWVKNGSNGPASSCPLCPQQQTFEAEEASGANTMQYGRIFATLGAPVRAARVTEAAGRKT
jgi:hypothetical protein